MCMWDQPDEQLFKYVVQSELPLSLPREDQEVFCFKFTPCLVYFES